MEPDWHEKWVKSELAIGRIVLTFNKVKAEYRKTITELEAEIKELKEGK